MSQTTHNMDKMGPGNSKFLQFLKQGFQPLATLATSLQGEKGANLAKTSAQ